MTTKRKTTKSKSVGTSAETKRLYRSATNKILGGVAAGIGDYFNFDPTVIRLIFVLLTLFGGSGIFIYFMLWILIPTESNLSKTNEENIRTNSEEIKDAAENLAVNLREGGNRNRTLGIIILILGALFLFNNLGVFDFINLGRLWPVVLIIFGLAILLRNDKNTKH